MDRIKIDSNTGNIVVSSMIRAAMPEMHCRSLMRVAHTVLENYTGPKLSTVTLNKRRTQVATLETCIHILNNAQGKNWDEWRITTAFNAFKQALRERVETVCSGQHAIRTEEQIDAVETKASALQKALRDMHIIGYVRIDEATGLGSLIDVVDLICPGKYDDYAHTALARVIARDDGERIGQIKLSGRDSLSDRIQNIQINGTDRKTPVSDAATIVEIIWLLPSRAAKEFRRKSAETICRVLGGDVSICQEIEQRCESLQSTEEGRAYQRFVTGEREPAKKKARIGPDVMIHATDEDYESFVKSEVTHELALRNMEQKHELTTRGTKNVQEELQTEVAIVFSIKDAIENIRPLGDMEKIELCDKISDIQYRMFKKVGGGGGGVVAGGGGDALVVVATAVADDATRVDPGTSVATPRCHASVRGDEISIAQISGFMGIRLGNKAGQVGKRMKVLYSSRYGAVAAANIPKRTTRYNGKPFSENVYYNRDRDMMERAINDVAAQS